MSDWDFLHEMHDRGYSADVIADAAACGYAPWHAADVDRQLKGIDRSDRLRHSTSLSEHSQRQTLSRSLSKKEHPSKDAVDALPPFDGLGLERIFVIKTIVQLKNAIERMHAEQFVGFDTESKPSWSKENARKGPHVLQFALSDRAYVIQAPFGMFIGPLQSLVESESVVKIGFGLNTDRGLLLKNFGWRLKTSVEMSNVLRTLQYKQRLGVRAAVAVVLGENLPKPKSVTTSNWAHPKLTDRQLVYAANDAFAALRVFRKMGSPYSSPASDPVSVAGAPFPNTKS